MVKQKHLQILSFLLIVRDRRVTLKVEGGGLTSDSKWGVGGGLKTLFLSIIETSPRKALIASSLQELEACLSLYISNYQCAPSAVGSCQH